MEFRDKIKQRRLELGKTLEEVAQIVGVSKTTVQRWESGNIQNLRRDKIANLAAALNLSPAYLMDWTEPTEKEAISVDFQSNAETSSSTSDGIFPYQPSQRIPVLGRVSAGIPLYAEENIESYIYTDLNHGGEYFGLRVQGDSMNAARIMEGDIVVVRIQDIVENGEIAVVMIGDDEATVKRFYRNGKIVTLKPQSTNQKHQPQVYDITETKVRVVGKVVQIQINI